MAESSVSRPYYRDNPLKREGPTESTGGKVTVTKSCEGGYDSLGLPSGDVTIHEERVVLVFDVEIERH